MNRKQRRAQKFGPADPMKTPSPPPQATLANAAKGIEINRGSSDQMPLSPAGVNQASKLGDQFAQKGGLDALVSAPSVRTKQTAAPIAAKNPKPLAQRDEPGLESFAEGNLEGEPAGAVKHQIRDLIRKNPQRVIPGQGAMTTAPGESFDDFRQRALPAVRGVMQQIAEGISKNPNYKVGFPWHSQTSKLTQAWLKKGAPDDFSIDAKEMDRPRLPPGTVEHLYPDEQGNWKLTPVDMASNEPLKPGGYGILHTLTGQSAENAAVTDDQQTHLAKMVGAARDLNFKAALQHAKGASKAGIPDDVLDRYMDGALPDAQTASNLSMPDLLATLAAAGPQKKSEYAPLVASHFGDLSGLAPADRAKLQNHLNALGYEVPQPS